MIIDIDDKNPKIWITEEQKIIFLAKGIVRGEIDTTCFDFELDDLVRKSHPSKSFSNFLGTHNNNSKHHLEPPVLNSPSID